MPHSWELTPREAVALQCELRDRVVAQDRVGQIRRVGGIDVSVERRRRLSQAAVAVVCLPELDLVDQARAVRPTSFPYVPGLLSFRELPVVLDALKRLQAWPDLFLCDGQGYAHPRRFGLACHLGIVVDTPTVGVAKTRLVGVHHDVPQERGAWRPLLDAGEVIGAVLRTRSKVRPVYVSVGHRISLQTALELVLQTAPRYRLPEPLRRAHRLASFDA